MENLGTDMTVKSPELKIGGCRQDLADCLPGFGKTEPKFGIFPAGLDIIMGMRFYTRFDP